MGQRAAVAQPSAAIVDTRNERREPARDPPAGPACRYGTGDNEDDGGRGDRSPGGRAEQRRGQRGRGASAVRVIRRMRLGDQRDAEPRSGAGRNAGQPPRCRARRRRTSGQHRREAAAHAISPRRRRSDTLATSDGTTQQSGGGHPWLIARSASPIVMAGRRGDDALDDRRAGDKRDRAITGWCRGGTGCCRPLREWDVMVVAAFRCSFRSKRCARFEPRQPAKAAAMTSAQIAG